MNDVNAVKALAHDIRNILSPALLVVECIKTEYPDVDVITLSKIYKAIDRTVEVCQAKLNELNGSVPTRTRHVNVFDIVYEAAELCKLHTSKDVNFVIEAIPSDRITIDRSTFFRIVVNLLQNAVHVVPAMGGEIKIRSRKNSKGQSISIIDNGTGIPDSIYKNLMDCFATNGEIGRNLGIGLPSTVKALSKMGGKLDVAYTGSNGTCFTLFLPFIRKETSNKLQIQHQ